MDTATPTNDTTQAIKWPAVDDHVVEPETGMEMIRGVIQPVRPNEPPHGDWQANLAYVLHPNVDTKYACALELLTRFAHDCDFAADASIRRRGPDPATGTRHLEEIVFEGHYEQALDDLSMRAQIMAARGVRRIFLIRVTDDPYPNGPVKEWSTRYDDWRQLDEDAHIDDPCFVRPVSIRGWLEKSEADNEVARAFLARRHPVLMEHLKKNVEAEIKEVQTEYEARLAELRARHEELERDLQEGKRLQAEGMKNLYQSFDIATPPEEKSEQDRDK